MLIFRSFTSHPSQSLPLNWASRKVLTRGAALLARWFSSRGCFISSILGSELWIFVYVNWASSCAYHHWRDAYYYQQIWKYFSILHKKIKAQNLFVLLWGPSNSEDLQTLISIIESADWNVFSIINNFRPKKRCHSIPNFSRRIEMTRYFA